jgi:hypothetical protein
MQNNDHTRVDLHRILLRRVTLRTNKALRTPAGDKYLRITSWGSPSKSSVNEGMFHGNCLETALACSNPKRRFLRSGCIKKRGQAN